VAAGVGWRLFTKDKPGESDGSTWFYFVAVLFALGLTLYFVPQVARWR
jgi:hypothetical protein